ncbi:MULTISPECIES: ABC transporter permease [Calditerrivibrio]|uniref:ABC transporter permease n=1 Tax=Calditerrivibrio nitroreducens TaxID=477976 RepID=A0A2J6WJL4_9BACT|nr:MAG: ABC transporter permease [Calditerrivibrio nitroreducens]
MSDSAKDISIISMAILYLFSGGLGLLIHILKLGILKDFIYSLIRMSFQLFLGSFVLMYIFKINTLWIVLLFFTLMSVVASRTIIQKSKIGESFFIYPIIFFTSFLLTFIFQVVIVGTDTWYDARYFITISGMIMGNSMNACAVALDRFNNDLKENYDLIETLFSFGASNFEAVSIFFKKSLRSALMPIITNMSSVGIVFFPGMMTGQILAGSNPTVAVKYQIAIMITIAIFVLISTMLNLYFNMKIALRKFLDGV